ncbi:MAG: phosphotransferase [Polyangiaceae bacterium]
MSAVIDKLHPLIEEMTGGDAATTVEEMPGGASTRQFFRVTLASGLRAVAIFVPDATRSDEIDKHGHRSEEWPFLEVQRLLQERGVRVPLVLGRACDDGFILVEDLGDDTLANYLQRHPERRTELYQSAVRDLALAQRALSPLPGGSVVSTRAFDEDLLRWEVDHFREWALEARGTHLDAAQTHAFAEGRDYLAYTIAHWPRHFVHRDYQSRNLMVRTDDGVPELVWIDFQDALLGPRVYDLVALLSDSYQVFDRAFVEARLDEYVDHAGLPQTERSAVGREFDLVTVQRKLKDAGRFVFIEKQRGNPHFLPFVAPTIEKVRDALSRLGDIPAMAALSAVLDATCPREN